MTTRQEILNLAKLAGTRLYRVEVEREGVVSDSLVRARSPEAARKALHGKLGRRVLTVVVE